MDAFQLFEVPRRPWLNPAALDEKYHEMAGEVHPDTGEEDAGDDEFSELNLAWRTLCEPPSRLRLLLELEFPGQRLGENLGLELSEEMVELFMDISSFTKRLKKYIADVKGSKTDMGIALLVDEGSEIVQIAKELLDRCYEVAVGLDAETKELDRAWIAEGRRDGAAIASLQHRWALIVKWRNKLREDLVTLEEELDHCE